MCKLQTNPLRTQIRNAKYANLTNSNAKPTTNKEDPSSMKPTSEENNQTWSFTVVCFIKRIGEWCKKDERAARGEMFNRKWWSPKGPVTYAGGYVSANIGEYLYSSRSSPHVCSSAGRINIDHPMRQTSEYISLFYFMNLWSSLSFDSIRISHRFENMPGLTECPRYSDNMGWLLAVIGCICLS